MGLDGGTYVSRTDVLRRQSWALAQADGGANRSTRGGAVPDSATYQPRVMDQQLAKHTQWTTCLLSGQPLVVPIAADWLGRLFNREAVLAFLLGRVTAFADEAASTLYVNQLRASGTAFDNLQSRRDVFAVQLSERCRTTEGSNSNGVTSTETRVESDSRFECPLTQLPCEKAPMAAIATCGHVLSARAIKQTIDHSCPLCSAPFQDDEVIPINGSSQQMDALRGLLPTRTRAKLKSGRKQNKKRKEVPLGATQSQRTAILST